MKEGTEEKENYYLICGIRNLSIKVIVVNTVYIKFMINLRYISRKHMLNYLECDWLRNENKQILHICRPLLLVIMTSTFFLVSIALSSQRG
jgi:hypothetical protein